MAITPYLLYEDVAEAMTFLAKAFGFRSIGETMRDATGRITHAAMRLGKDVVMMGYPGPTYRNPDHLGQVTQNLYVNVPDVDRHFRRATRAGARILESPKDQFYGDRRYGATDPEGHAWYFASPVRRRKQAARPARQAKATKAKSRPSSSVRRTSSSAGRRKAR